MAIPSALFLLFSRNAPERSLQFSKLVLVVGVVSVLFMPYVLFLRALPKYFLFAACLVAMVVGIALAEVWRRRGIALVLVVLAFVLVVNVIFMEPRRGLGLYNERRLVEVSSSRPETIFTDPAIFQYGRIVVTLARYAAGRRCGEAAAGRAVLPQWGSLIRECASGVVDC